MEAFTDSLRIAKAIGYDSRTVYLLIENHTNELEKFGKLSFQMIPLEGSSTNQTGKVYRLNEKQATLLVTFMRNNKKVVEFKVRLVEEFYKMKEWIALLKKTSQSYTILSDAVQQFYNSSEPKYFTNEINMINRIVLGKTSKQMREELKLKAREPIRPHLNTEQLSFINELQKADKRLLADKIEYQQRKEKLTEYYNNLCNKQEKCA